MGYYKFDYIDAEFLFVWKQNFVAEMLPISQLF